MRWVDRVIAVVLIAAAVPLWIESARFPGNGTIFPRVMLGTLVLLAIALLARSLAPAARLASDFLGSAEPRAILRAIAVFVFAAAAVMAMRYVGFFAAMIGLCALIYLMLQVDNRRLYASAIVLLLAFVYAVFVVFLNVPLTADQML